MSHVNHNPPFRAEHIGSFIRPAALLQARRQHTAGLLSAADLRVREDQAIADFVQLQQQLGFKLVTDGELRRSSYAADFTTSGLTGVATEQGADDQWSYTDASGRQERARLPVVYDRIRWNNSHNAEHFSYLASITTATPKMTLPGPCYIHFRAGRQRISRDAYPDLADFWSDLVTAYAIELGKLHDAGCRYIQLDETSLAKFGDPKIRQALSERGDAWDKLLDQYIEVINAIVTRAPKDMRIGMHLCRGNRMGHWQAAGGYDVVAEKLFRRLALEFFFLEYDSERAGTFEPLAMMPDHKIAVLGLISTKVAELESSEYLLARIKDCARYVDVERLGISPQCGFSSSEKGNTIMSYERAVEKLARVAEVARHLWGD